MSDDEIKAMRERVRDAEQRCGEAKYRMNVARTEKSRARWERTAQRWLDIYNDLTGRGAEDEQDAAPPSCCIDARGEYEPCREHREGQDESFMWDEIMGRVRV